MIYVSNPYQQLYAYLVGQIDDTLQYTTEMFVNRTFDKEHTLHAMEILKNALWTAEERYLDAGNDDFS